MPDSGKTISLDVFERLMKRERLSRKEAEQLLDAKSIELFEANQLLRKQADELEARVRSRTAELEAERNKAFESSAALRVSEQRFNDVASIVGEYLWELDTQFRFTSVTRQIEVILGYSSEDLIGESIFDYMPSLDAAEIRQTLLSQTKKKKVFTNLLHRAYTISGDLVWQRSSGSPDFNSDGEFIGFRGASLDVSEQEYAKLEMQQLVIALEHAGDGIAISNKEGVVTFANQAHATMFGYVAKQSVVGVEWSSFFKSTESLRMAEGIESVSSEGIGLRLDQSEFPGHFSVNRLPNGDLLWISRDETERISTLMSVRTQNSQLTALLENIRIGVIFEGSAEASLIHNKHAGYLLGLTEFDFASETVATGLFERIKARSDDAKYLRQIDLLMQLGNDESSAELQFDEDVFFVFDRIPVYVEKDYRGALWTIRDVSEERLRGAVLEEAKLQAEAGARVKSAFLANMSHEIRTPLNGICGMARLLNRERLSSTSREHVLAIQTSADSLLHILNDILDFSKVEAGQIDLEVVEFDLAKVFDTTFSILRSKAVEQGVRFDFIYPSIDFPLVYGDPSRLEQILLNLLGNALKFTLQGSVNLVARLIASNSSELVISITIQDTGIGMSVEELGKIFQPFSQADSSISRRFGGTGLGLSICRNLIQLMGGTLSVDSDPGLGSCFTIKMVYEPATTSRVLEVNSRVPENQDIWLITKSDSLFYSIQSILDYSDFHVRRFSTVSEVVEELASLADFGSVLLILDRSFDTDYIPEFDLEIESLLPYKFRLIVLVNDTAKSDEPQIGFNILNYPFSRYGFLNSVYSIFDCELPLGLFHSSEFDSAEPIQLSGLRVLLAEDNIINQKVGRLTIEGFGAEVDIAANGVEVLKLLENFEYDVVLMDIRMPEMDGVEACKRIRALGKQLPIYALTADAMKGDRERFIESGMNGYLSKPLNEKELLRLLMDNHLSYQVSSSEGGGSPENESLSVQAESFYLFGLDAPILDEGSLREIGGDNFSVIVSLLGEFIDLADQSFHDGKSAFEAQDWHTTRAHFHKLAGSCAAVCALQLQNFALSLERALMGDSPDQAFCKSVFFSSEAGLSSLRVEIERIQNELKIDEC